MRQFQWPHIEACSGLTRADIEAAAAVYRNANATIACYGMGLTQHRSGVLAIQMLSNLLLMRGNIGKPGAGIFPVRGHSNVQGQRTVGITEKPELVPLDRLAEQFGFDPPRAARPQHGRSLRGRARPNVKAFVALGGNFIRAVPETDIMERAWRHLQLTVQIVTKLNRGALIHGRCRLPAAVPRTHRDRPAGDRCAIRVRRGHDRALPCLAWTGRAGERALAVGAKDRCRAGKGDLPPNPKLDWDAWSGDYARVRDAIAGTYPAIFANFNERIKNPQGFDRPLPARERKWATPNGKANFISPRSLSEDPDLPLVREGVLTLITVRSNDQFNTTVYGYNDRLRGINGTRMVVLMNAQDMARAGASQDGDEVDLLGAAGDNVPRIVRGLRVVTYDVPRGCCVGYYPECNPLLPLWHYAEGSKVPAAKSIPVRIHQPTSAVLGCRDLITPDVAQHVAMT